MQRRVARFSLLATLAEALLLVAAADVLFHHRIGSWLGGLALAWLAALMLVRPALRHGHAAVAADSALSRRCSGVAMPGGACQHSGDVKHR